MEIVAPASSANIGPGFDALGLALDLPFRVWFGDDRPMEETHPGMRAFRGAGGTGPLSWRSPIPPGRGLGFSAAARVAGLAAAVVQRGDELDASRPEIYERATELEGHPDNAAPSTYGGLTISAGDRLLPLELGLDAAVVAWVPDDWATSTDASRSRLPETIPFADAVFNIGRTALLVGALTTGNATALAGATTDRLHQDGRLELVPNSRAALDVLATRSLAAWLSGSGPTVAAFVERHGVDDVGADLPEGRVLVLDVDRVGVRVIDG
ncbi:MAG: homoserine kinase [Actinomycetota bacterium]